MADATNKVYYCPIELAVDLVASKWKPALLGHLSTRIRVGELRRRMPLVNARVLRQLLHELERDGLIEQVLHSDFGDLEEFALSESGRRLAPLLAKLGAFGKFYAAEQGIEILKEGHDEPIVDGEEADEASPALPAERWPAWSWLPL